eukprot:TRINITY_DN1396_c0_g1_i1.p1 TRINITY_DN1396_c0_g1~~TRINITY_DN1396_c0_g1_i1.p1  ORF type:complete len:325 (-),score=135.91 TRINITY_DN1396_c0_g1_i1:219-1193(-)
MITDISYCILSWLSQIVGVVVIARLLFVLIFKIIAELKGVNYKNLGAKNGGWAVITGASDGIGKAYAFELAKKGFNIYLISRTLSKLEAVAEEIQSKYNVDTKIKSVDFMKVTSEDYEEIEQEVNSFEQVGILVNNVGINYSFPEDILSNNDGSFDEAIIDVNIKVQTRMTRIVLPKMIEKKAGGIISLSSFAGLVPTPLLSVYSGTKAYNNNFSQSLYFEFSKHGIVSQSVTPGVVVSNMSKVSKKHAGLMIALPEAIAAKSLARLGKDIEVSPHFPHAVLNYIFGTFLPRRFALGVLYGESLKIQKRAISKKKREANEKKSE